MRQAAQANAFSVIMVPSNFDQSSPSDIAGNVEFRFKANGVINGAGLTRELFYSSGSLQL